MDILSMLNSPAMWQDEEVTEAGPAVWKMQLASVTHWPNPVENIYMTETTTFGLCRKLKNAMSQHCCKALVWCMYFFTPYSISAALLAKPENMWLPPYLFPYVLIRRSPGNNIREDMWSPPLCLRGCAFVLFTKRFQKCSWTPISQQIF